MTKGSEYYHWYKAAGICPKCKSAPVTKGRSACPNCLDAEAERQRRRRDFATDAEKKAMCDKASATKAALYQRRKEQGLCVACGKRKAQDRRVRCGICLAKERRAAERFKRKNGVMSIQDKWAEGCICGKPAMHGKKVCEDCYVIFCRNAEKGREAQKRSGYRWDKIGYGVL